MRLNIGNLTIRNLIISYILLYTIMPIVSQLTSIYLTTYFYMAVVVALVILILVLDRPENLNTYGSVLLPIAIYQILMYFAQKTETVLWGYQTLLFLLPVILGYFFLQDPSRLHKIYVGIVIIALLVTMITTIIGCINNPNASRELARANQNDEYAIRFSLQNIGGYHFIYYVVLLYPVLILSYKTKRINLISTVFLTIVIFLTIIFSEYTTALLLFVVSSVLFFLRRNLSLRDIVIVSVFAVAFLFLFSNIVSELLHRLGEISGSESIKERLDALSGGASGLEKIDDKRVDLYYSSINSFLKHPLFGFFFENEKSNGGHSFIFDNLARFGLFGGALLVFIYRIVFVHFFLPFKDKPSYGYVVWTFIQVIILSIVNTGMWLEVLCLFCPILFYWIYGTDSKTEEAQNEDTVDS